MSAREVTAKADSLIRADRALDTLGAGDVRWSAWVPGRIEIFGKHTDYAGGRSLLCAVERGFVVRAARRADRLVRATDVATGGVHTIEFGRPPSSAARGSWALYIDTVVRRVARNFPAAMHGVDLAFVSDLPIAAGMSSSSALVIAAFTMIAEANDLRGRPEYRRQIGTPEELASYLGCVENGEDYGALRGDAGVGTFGGSEDHVTILCSASGEAAQYTFAPVCREGAYRVPADHLFVIASSGVAAEKSAGARDAYNRMSLMVRHLLAEWNRVERRADGSLAAAARSSPYASDRLRAIAANSQTATVDGSALVNRLEQFLLESFEIVPAAGAALASADWRALGALAMRSQHAAETLLGNQVPETSFLVRSARELGARASTAFGAGFGGSVWALVPATEAGGFAERWASRYAEAFPAAANRAEFFTSQAGPGVHVW